MTYETLPQPETFAAACADVGLTIDASFVPWSQSSSKKDRPTFEDYNLNWRITLRHADRPVLVTDYSAGMAHCPSYRQMAHRTQDYVDAIKAECESGKRATDSKGNLLSFGRTGPAIVPDSVSAIWSLIQDCDVLNAGTFEDWADEYGYDKDSRSAESIYRACLQIALQIQHAIGTVALERLRDASRDF